MLLGGIRSPTPRCCRRVPLMAQDVGCFEFDDASD
jgi:hypothetical protein